MWFVIDWVGFDNSKRCHEFDDNHDNCKDVLSVRELDGKWRSYMMTTRESLKTWI